MAKTKPHIFLNVWFVNNLGIVDVKSSTIDKFAKNISDYDRNSKIKLEDLVTYSKDHLTNYFRIDEKRRTNFWRKNLMKNYAYIFIGEII